MGNGWRSEGQPIICAVQLPDLPTCLGVLHALCQPAATRVGQAEAIYPTNGRATLPYEELLHAHRTGEAVFANCLAMPSPAERRATPGQALS